MKLVLACVAALLSLAAGAEPYRLPDMGLSVEVPQGFEFAITSSSYRGDHRGFDHSFGPPRGPDGGRPASPQLSVGIEPAGPMNLTEWRASETGRLFFDSPLRLPFAATAEYSYTGTSIACGDGFSSTSEVAERVLVFEYAGRIHTCELRAPAEDFAKHLGAFTRFCTSLRPDAWVR